MKKILIVKTGAAGDVLRTTFVLEHLTKDSEVYWLTDKLCTDLIDKSITKVYTDISDLPNIFYDTVYCLEEDIGLVKSIQSNIKCKKYVGYYEKDNSILYQGPNTEWFDMSLNSIYGIEKANKLKFENKKTFQDLIAPIFEIQFSGESYNNLEYKTKDSIVSGNIGISKFCGNKWPNKNWAYYDDLKSRLEDLGHKVNYLPNRDSIKQHIADIASHNLIISGDSLPMHIATALKKPSIALFICTSPWEIYDYGLITKVITHNLQKYYYVRESHPEITREISIDQVIKLIN